VSASFVSVVGRIGDALVKVFVDSDGPVKVNSAGSALPRRIDVRSMDIVTRGAFDSAKSAPGVAAAYKASHDGATMPDDHLDIADLPHFAFMLTGDPKSQGRYETWSLENIIRFGPNTPSLEAGEALWAKVDAWLTTRENA